ncbi:MAG: hypothetical protein P4L79_01660 [Legionella sp.]|uniref:hypothetical protein n=1 Tax=Legionella sp. TaxID=459 RepID=UPI00283CDD5F|nr:hypothetical protein [Legionella sp.]
MQQKPELNSIMEDDADNSHSSIPSGSAVAAAAPASASASAAANGYTPKRAPTQLEIIGNLPTRTNSVLINSNGVVRPIKPDERNYLNNFAPKRDWDWRDGLKIAVFSQEASRNFATKFHVKIQTDAGYQSYSGMSPCHLDLIAREQLLANVNYYPNVKTYPEALTKLFENRGNPQVIVVVEGKRDNLPKEFTLTSPLPPGNTAAAAAAATAATGAATAATAATGAATAATGAAIAATGAAAAPPQRIDTYKLHDDYIQGTNRLKRADNKQSMHFYVRNDMREAITTDSAVIVTNEFIAGEIRFETASGKYSVLVPHIPNKIAKNPTDADQLLRNYAEVEREKSDRIVVGYIGDTNYNRVMQEYSNPATGGLNGSMYVVPTSSSAGKHTHFMQAISFGTAQDGSFLMQQPTTLNHVDLRFGNGDKTATDHPSIQTTILLDSYIQKREYDPNAETDVEPDSEPDYDSDVDAAAVTVQPNTVQNSQFNVSRSGSAAAAQAHAVKTVQQNAQYSAAFTTTYANNAPPPQPNAQQLAVLAAAQAHAIKTAQQNAQYSAAFAGTYANNASPPQPNVQQLAVLAAAQAHAVKVAQQNALQLAALAATRANVVPNPQHNALQFAALAAAARANAASNPQPNAQQLAALAAARAHAALNSQPNAQQLAALAAAHAHAASNPQQFAAANGVQNPQPNFQRRCKEEIAALRNNGKITNNKEEDHNDENRMNGP